MPEVRQRFSEELRALEDEAQQTAARAQLLLEQALQALLGDHLEICDQVVRGDDEVDALYLDVERRILHLFALQTPVAIDLRLLTALLHINLHLERVGDQAVNIAKIAKLADGLPRSQAYFRTSRRWARRRCAWSERRWTHWRNVMSTSPRRCPS
jgi:phosphate transport system protein